MSDVVEVIPGAADQFPDFHSVGRDLRAPGNWQRETGNSRLAHTAPAQGLVAGLWRYPADTGGGYLVTWSVNLLTVSPYLRPP